jgi:OFA family oxalate/formate antiporter-like MFS transporter
MDQKVMNRWLPVLGAILIQLCLGAIYAWSVFTKTLTDPAGAFKFTAAQTQIIFSVGLGMFALLMPIAGRLQAKPNIGPRKVALAGGLLLGLGYVLAGLFGTSFFTLVLFIGVLGGAGIGLAYVCPLGVGVRWFPDKKGLITGLAVAGFGFGALLWVQLADAWGHLIQSMGVLKVFLIYGVVFAVVVAVGSIFMVYPPDGWKPAGWDPKAATAGGKPAAAPVEDMVPGEVLRTPRFYLLWTSYVFCALAGLMVIGIAKLFGADALKESGAYTDGAAAAAAASTSYAIFFALANGLGRIAWGSVADFLGWKKSIVIMALTQGVAMVCLYYLGGSYAMLSVFFAVVGANFGGTLALFPVATASNFGAKNLGLNYGWMFTAYGVGGIVGPIVAGVFKDMGKGKGLSAWMPPFMLAAVLCLLAAGIILAVKAPKRAAA